MSAQSIDAGNAPAPGSRLDGRVVLVAGAAGGLGAAASRACAAAGATVVLLGRKVAKLNRVYDSAAQLGPEPLLYPLDMEGASPDDYAELATRLASEVGRLDGLLHCAADFAGLTPFALADPAANAEFDRLTGGESSRIQLRSIIANAMLARHLTE